MKNAENSRSSTFLRSSSFTSGESGLECFSKNDLVRLNHSVEKMSSAASLLRASCQLYTARCCRVGFELEASIASTGTDFAPMVLGTVAKAVSRVRLITRRSTGCLMELDPS
jgi:hypothetical protein